MASTGSSLNPGYDRQNDLNEVMSRIMNDANLTPEEREYVLATTAGALMETYQHGYWDASNGLGSKVRESDMEDRPSERDVDDWFASEEERAGWENRRGAAMDSNGAAIYTGPREDLSRWGDDGGPVSS